jgi:dihydrofolate reductase
MRGIIVAVSPEGVIGLGGKIPWHYRGDLRRFKRVTTGSTVIMGRKTWESIGKPLPDRRNVVVARAPVAAPGVETFASLREALARVDGPVWFIGGARVYEEAMSVADVIDVTYVPDHVTDPAAVRFPPIDPAAWEAGPLAVHEDEPALNRRLFTRRRG